MANPEVHTGSESNVEIQNAAAERSAELQRKTERAGELSPESQTERVDTARQETKEVFAREAGKEKKSGGEPTASGIRRVTKRERDASYDATMKLIHKEMTAGSRAFSKLIHAPVVEKSSEVIGSSFARPNAVLAGSSTALVLVSLTYVTARTFGYQLSGFETIGAFIIGWALGIMYDFVRVMAFGKR